MHIFDIFISLYTLIVSGNEAELCNNNYCHSTAEIRLKPLSSCKTQCFNA